jgi:hypothetical protein
VHLFDATGTLVQEVAPLEWRDAGAYDAEVFMQGALPAGIYFIVLQTAGKNVAIPIVKE